MVLNSALLIPRPVAPPPRLMTVAAPVEVMVALPAPALRVPPVSTTSLAVMAMVLARLFPPSMVPALVKVPVLASMVTLPPATLSSPEITDLPALLVTPVPRKVIAALPVPGVAEMFALLVSRPVVPSRTMVAPPPAVVEMFWLTVSPTPVRLIAEPPVNDVWSDLMPLTLFTVPTVNEPTLLATVIPPVEAFEPDTVSPPAALLSINTPPLVVFAKLISPVVVAIFAGLVPMPVAASRTRVCPAAVPKIPPATAVIAPVVIRLKSEVPVVLAEPAAAIEIPPVVFWIFTPPVEPVGLIAALMVTAPVLAPPSPVVAPPMVKRPAVVMLLRSVEVSPNPVFVPRLVVVPLVKGLSVTPAAPATVPAKFRSSATSVTLPAPAAMGPAAATVMTLPAPRAVRETLPPVVAIPATPPTPVLSATVKPFMST